MCECVEGLGRGAWNIPVLYQAGRLQMVGSHRVHPGELGSVLVVSEPDKLQQILASQTAVGP